MAESEQPRRRIPPPASASAPWLPVDYEKSDASALQALATGTANPDQQRRALDWIITKACSTYDFPYRPGGHEGERDTCIALGRQMVGQQIVKLLRLALSSLPNREPNADQHEPKF